MGNKSIHLQTVQETVAQARSNIDQLALLFLIFKVIVTIALVLIEQTDD